MPELPEVETMARDLRPHLIGARIVSGWVDAPKLIRHPLEDVEAFLREISGKRIQGIERRAKWLLFTLSGARVLTIQPVMTGVLLLAAKDSPRHPHDHLGLRLADGREFRLRDMRKFAKVGLYRRGPDGEPLSADGSAPLSRLGPEPLEDGFSAALFGARLSEPAFAGQPIKPLLMNQAFLAGVGNIYADEALWRARLHPLRRASTLSTSEVHRLHAAVVEALAEGVANRGAGVSDYRPPDGEARMQEHLDAYQRTGLPCHRCQTPISRLVVGGRGTHICPRCQPLASVTAA